MLVKGTAFTISFYCYQRATGEGATGKAATLSSYISKDGGAPAATTNSPAEVDATNQPGIYSLSLTAQETNADNIVITTQSSQSGVEAQPIFITTEPAIPTASDVATAVNVSGALTSYGAAKTSDVPTASDVATAVNVSGALTNYGAAKTSDVPTASDVAAAVNVSGALTSYGAAKTSDVPTASDVATAVNVSGALNSYGAARPAEVVGALDYYGAAKTSDVPTASDVAAAVNVSGALNDYGAAKASDVPTASDIAAAVLTTNVSIAQAGAPADSLLGLVLANFYSSIDTDGTWTIYQTDGETQFTQKKVITSSNADPVTGITKKS